ncbi:MAG: type IV pilin protein [Magnetovibrionaceae bacterium]
MNIQPYSFCPISKVLGKVIDRFQPAVKAQTRRKSSGFTLIELMVVTVVIGILAAIGIPYFQNYILQGNLVTAEPYLLQIASQNRVFKVRTGRYFHSSTNDEQDLEDTLGVDLRDAGSYCFMVVCKTASICSTSTDGSTENASSGSHIANAESGDATIEFEVHAVLRSGTSTSVGGPAGTCLVADDKLDGEGWIRSGDQKGAAGRAVVYRYPQPESGLDTVSGHDGRNYSWNNGITFTDAITD